MTRLTRLWLTLAWEAEISQHRDQAMQASTESCLSHKTEVPPGLAYRPALRETVLFGIWGHAIDRWFCVLPDEESVSNEKVHHQWDFWHFPLTRSHSKICHSVQCVCAHTHWRFTAPSALLLHIFCYDIFTLRWRHWRVIFYVDLFTNIIEQNNHLFSFYRHF